MRAPQRIRSSCMAVDHNPQERMVRMPCRPPVCMQPYLIAILLLCCSNIFMTIAWYGHLKSFAHAPWLVAALVSWGIALFEYLIQVPANRIGHQVMNVGQLKILQEVITLTIFLPFSIFYLKEKPNSDYLWAGLCILGAVFFIFRKKLFAS
jgi:LPXTG-motif cell wall-anchored protein